jgi:hypothetical protein
MPTEKQNREFQQRVGALRKTLVDRLAGELGQNPQLGELLSKQLDELIDSVEMSDAASPLPPDQGLAALVGLGADASKSLGSTQEPRGVEPYDERSGSRLAVVGSIYYLWQHERIGVFRVVQKLQELFRAGAVRLAEGDGAFRLYQFDRREVLRYTQRDRLAAYRRVLGYGSGSVPSGGRENTDFHRLLTHFITQVSLFWRDKRVSDVVRERSYDPSFGSIAIVRRAGLDLRNNLKWSSFGHLSVMRVEVMQLLNEAFRILESDDIKKLFGADNAWDVVEEVLVRYFRERLVTSPRQRMAIAGRAVLEWLGQPHILETQRVPFETLLLQIAEYSEEWLTSAEAMGFAMRTSDRRRVLPWTERTASPAPSPVASPAERGHFRSGRTPVRGRDRRMDRSESTGEY